MGSANHDTDSDANGDKARRRVAQNDQLCFHGAQGADTITLTVVGSKDGLRQQGALHTMEPTVPSSADAVAVPMKTLQTGTLAWRSTAHNTYDSDRIWTSTETLTSTLTGSTNRRNGLCLQQVTKRDNGRSLQTSTQAGLTSHNHTEPCK